MAGLTRSQREKIKKVALAEKHGVSPAYVGQILRGDKEPNTECARAIMRDALAILKIVDSTSR